MQSTEPIADIRTVTSLAYTGGQKEDGVRYSIEASAREIETVLEKAGTAGRCPMEESEERVKPYGELGEYLHEYRHRYPLLRCYHVPQPSSPNAFPTKSSAVN